MRECIYCGRQLEKGERCDCAMSVAKRREKEAAGAAEEQKSGRKDRAEERERRRNERSRKRSEKEREKEQKRHDRERARHSSYSAGHTAYTNKFGYDYRDRTRTAFGDVWRIFKTFLRSPIDTVLNPGSMSVSVIMIFVIIEGIMGGLSVFSIVSGASRGPVRLLGSLMGFSGAAGYNTLLGWLASAFSGAVGGIILFFIASGIFYMMNKWIFKEFTPYWEFSKRFSLVGIPTAVIGAVGVILGFFSQTTFAVLTLVGLVGTVILLYEVMRASWYSRSGSKALYMLLIGVFVFLMIVLYIVRISVL